MTFDEQQLKLMEELIEDLTPVADMCLLMGIPEFNFRTELANSESLLAQRFYYKTAEVRRKIRHRDIELAEANSPTAAAAVADHLKQFEQSL